MEDSPDDLTELAHELLKEFGGLGHRMRPSMRNASRGEMGILHELMCAQQGLTPTELAERSHLTSARVANVLRSLEEKGFIVREHSSVDRRRVTVRPTEAGRAHMERGRAEFESQASAFLAQLGEKDAQEALRILRRINQTIDQNREKRGEGARANH